MQVFNSPDIPNLGEAANKGSQFRDAGLTQCSSFTHEAISVKEKKQDIMENLICYDMPPNDKDTLNSASCEGLCTPPFESESEHIDLLIDAKMKEMVDSICHDDPPFPSQSNIDALFDQLNATFSESQQENVLMSATQEIVKQGLESEWERDNTHSHAVIKNQTSASFPELQNFDISVAQPHNPHALSSSTEVHNLQSSTVEQPYHNYNVSGIPVPDLPNSHTFLVPSVAQPHNPHSLLSSTEVHNLQSSTVEQPYHNNNVSGIPVPDLPPNSCTFLVPQRPPITTSNADSLSLHEQHNYYATSFEQSNIPKVALLSVPESPNGYLLSVPHGPSATIDATSLYFPKQHNLPEPFDEQPQIPKLSLNSEPDSHNVYPLSVPQQPSVILDSASCSLTNQHTLHTASFSKVYNLPKSSFEQENLVQIPSLMDNDSITKTTEANQCKKLLIIFPSEMFVSSKNGQYSNSSANSDNTVHDLNPPSPPPKVRPRRGSKKPSRFDDFQSSPCGGEENQSRSSKQLSDAEKFRRMRHINNIASKKCREKKKMWLEALEDDIQKEKYRQKTLNDSLKEWEEKKIKWTEILMSLSKPS